MTKLYSTTLLLLLAAAAFGQPRRLIKATSSGDWGAAATWTTTGNPTTPGNNDSIVIASGVTVSISGNGTTYNVQDAIVDIFGTLVFNEASGATKHNNLNIVTASSNPVPIVRLATGATITKGSSANGTANINAYVGGTVVGGNIVGGTPQLKYSTGSVSGVPAGQTAGPTINGPAFAQNTTGQPLYFTTGSNAALPLTLTMFKASVNGNNVVINWTSQQEINTQMFLIERSTNGSSWKQVGAVPARGGASGVATNYQFEDIGAPALSYYRIKIVDNDGKTTYTSTLMTRLTNSDINVSIFPNPAVNSVNISIGSNLSQQGFTVNVLNHTGQLIAHRQIGAGTSVLSFDLTNYKTGMYTFDILFTGGTRETHKLVVTK